VTISRRTVLLGALAGAGLTACSNADPSAGTSTRGTFVSRRRGGARTPWTVLYPPDHHRASLPVLIALHGRSQDQNYAQRTLHLDRYLAKVVRGGAQPFAIASVYGGDHDYWHPRRGTDPGGMVISEFLPLLAGQGLDVARIGLFGWSMGGYGALYLAGVLGRARCAVAIAESPAIWRHSDESAAGAFDDAEDFDRHAVFGRQARFTGIPLRIDCGASDGFAPVTRDLRASIEPTPAGGIEPGGHDSTYWRGQAAAQLAFAARHL
jgi:hypothetical protein